MVPLLRVVNISQTIEWYQDIGFTCTATNHIWESNCELNWARIEWKGAAFMIVPDDRNVIHAMKDASLWFNLESIDHISDVLKTKKISMDIESETFYGRKVVTFKDLNGFQNSFSCEIK